MACSINMFNTDQHQHQHQAMSPRISFSNDFAVDPPPPTPSAPRISDPNFEFSVGTRPMMAADELFFKGRMLPLRSGQRANTLRDELRAQDDDGAWDSARPPKGIKWKELLGLKKRSERESAEAITGKNEQEKSSDGGARAEDTETGL